MNPAHRFAAAAVAALALLQLVWELWLAPLRPGGSWLALKALPLLLTWLALQRYGARARQGSALVLLLYFVEGVVRGWSESGRHAVVALASAALALAAFGALYFAARKR